MKKNLKSYPLTDEEINMMEVFMLLYGYTSLDELLSKSQKELQKHKDWNDQIASCVNRMKSASA